MKRKFISVLLALMLVLSFSLVPVVPVFAHHSQQVTDSGSTADQPDVAIDSQGNVHIAYSDDDGTSTYEIWYTMLDNDGNTLIAGTLITPDDEYKSRRPAIVVDSEDKVHIIWQDKRDWPHSSFSGGGEIYYTKLDPSLDDQNGDAADESAITVPELDDTRLTDLSEGLEAYADYIGHPRIAIDSIDNIHIVFESYDTGIYYMQIDSDGHMNVTPPILLKDLSLSYAWRTSVSVAVDSNNDVHIAWNDEKDTVAYETYYMMLDGIDGSVLIDSTLITPDDEDRSKGQSIVVDDEDKVHIIWKDRGGDGQAVYYTKLDPSLDPGDITLIPGKAISQDSSGYRAKSVASAIQDGYIHISWWEDYEEDEHGYLYYMVLDTDGNIVVPEAALTTTETVTTSTSWTVPYLDVDANGKAHIVWCDDRTGNYEVWYATGNIVENETKGRYYILIQDAIDAASASDILSVGAGTYTEDLSIPATLTDLELAGAPGATIKGVAMTASNLFPLTAANIEILADGVKIHGFTIQGPDPLSDYYSSGMIIGGANVEIYLNDFEVTNTADTLLNDVSQGLQTYRDTAIVDVDISGLSIHDNTFTHHGAGTIGFEAIFINRDVGTGAITIADNELSGYIVRGISTESSNSTISGNTLSTDATGLILAGIQARDYDAEDQDTVSITGNTIEGFTPGVKLGGGLQALTGITVTGNTIFNCNGIGINLNNVSDGTVSGNIIRYVTTGIELSSSGGDGGLILGNIISGNTINYFTLGYGIYLEESNFNTVEYNIIGNDEGYADWGLTEGIYLHDSHYNELLDNTISWLGDGIDLEGYDSEDEITGNMVRGNTISDVFGGIYLAYADTNYLLENDISMFGNEGVYITFDASNNVVAGNIISNEGHPEWDTTPSSTGIYLEYGDSDTIGAATVNEEPIPGNTISWVYDGIYIADSVDISVLDNEITNSYNAGIYLDSNVAYSLIDGNDVSQSQYGIYLWQTDGDNEITGNTVHANEYGIYLYDDDNETINENIVSHNDYGIFLWLSSYNDILDNVVGANTEVGIALAGPGEGDSSNNTVSGNLVVANGEGILINGVNNTITGNQISGNWSLEGPEEPEEPMMTGIHLTTVAYGNEIHENNILRNTLVVGGRELSFGLEADSPGNNDATWNYWGDASGPYNETWNPLGTGDTAIEAVDSIVPWASERYPFVPVITDAADPVITGAVALPDMISVTGYFWSEGTVGPYETNLVVEASDDIFVSRVFVNMKEAYYQLFPFLDPDDPEEPFTTPAEWNEEKVQAWEMMMGESSYMEHVPMEYNRDGGIWQLMEMDGGEFSLNDIIVTLENFFGYNEVMRWLGEEMEMGDISIPVTAYDAFHKEATGEIELGVVSSIRRLKEGWNLRSTLVTLAPDTWGEITALGDGLEFDVAYRYDPDTTFTVLTPTDTIDPLEAIYIHVTAEHDTLGLNFDTHVTPVPARDLKAGWSLVGLAVSPGTIVMWSDDALISIEEDNAGLRGYSQAVSVEQYMNGYTEYYYYGDYEIDSHSWSSFNRPSWVFTFGGSWEWMQPTGGYWVFMEHADTLAGFSYTPVLYED